MSIRRRIQIIGSCLGAPLAIRKAAHDVSQEPRDWHGRWTRGGGIGPAVNAVSDQPEQEWETDGKNRWWSGPYTLKRLRGLGFVLSYWDRKIGGGGETLALFPFEDYKKPAEALAAAKVKAQQHANAAGSAPTAPVTPPAAPTTGPLAWTQVNTVTATSGPYTIFRDARTGVHTLFHTDPATGKRTTLATFPKGARGAALAAAKVMAQQHANAAGSAPAPAPPAAPAAAPVPAAPAPATPATPAPATPAAPPSGPLAWTQVNTVTATSGPYTIFRDARTGVHTLFHTDPATGKRTTLATFPKGARGAALAAAKVKAQQHANAAGSAPSAPVTPPVAVTPPAAPATAPVPTAPAPAPTATPGPDAWMGGVPALVWEASEFRPSHLSSVGSSLNLAVEYNKQGRFATVWIDGEAFATFPGPEISALPAAKRMAQVLEVHSVRGRGDYIPPDPASWSAEKQAKYAEYREMMDRVTTDSGWAEVMDFAVEHGLTHQYSVREHEDQLRARVLAERPGAYDFPPLESFSSVSQINDWANKNWPNTVWVLTSECFHLESAHACVKEWCDIVNAHPLLEYGLDTVRGNYGTDKMSSSVSGFYWRKGNSVISEKFRHHRFIVLNRQYHRKLSYYDEKKKTEGTGTDRDLPFNVMAMGNPYATCFIHELGHAIHYKWVDNLVHQISEGGTRSLRTPFIVKVSGISFGNRMLRKLVNGFLDAQFYDIRSSGAFSGYSQYSRYPLSEVFSEGFSHHWQTMVKGWNTYWRQVPDYIHRNAVGIDVMLKAMKEYQVTQFPQGYRFTGTQSGRKLSDKTKDYLRKLADDPLKLFDVLGSSGYKSARSALGMKDF